MGTPPAAGLSRDHY